MKISKEWILDKLLKSKYPTHKGLLLNQIKFLIGFATVAVIFIYFVSNGTILATSEFPSSLGWISDKIFNIDRAYKWLGAFILAILVYFILLYVDRKSKLKAKGLRVIAIFFNKLLGVFAVFMGLALFLDIASYQANFIDPINSIEFIFIGLLASHSLVYAIKNFKL